MQFFFHFGKMNKGFYKFTQYNLKIICLEKFYLEIFFQQYPNPKDKQRTFASWSKAIKSSTAEEILAASRNYANETKGREKQYIKTSSNFLGRDQIYKDYLVREEKPKPKPRKIIIQEIDR